MNISNCIREEKSQYSKISSDHLNRKAIVYIRQSTIQQLERNKESTRLQYSLRDMAVSFGWSKSRICIIDDDQGVSAQSSIGRPGFQKLLAEVGLNKVGIVFGIEMSRLARSCKDWYQLLELCALFQTLIGDQDGIYDPNNYNDRLLLGLKGAISEAELHILHSRMNNGRLNKAKRGDLCYHIPTGYIRTEDKHITLDPDEQVRYIIKLILNKFKELGSVHSLLKFMVKNGIQIGIRSYCLKNKNEVEWRKPSRQTLSYILNNPIYAGVYCYGRRTVDPKKKRPGKPSTGRIVKQPEDYFVLIKNHHPAYISWEEYEENRRILQKNRCLFKQAGPFRNGMALLSGIIYCGRCGHRMSAHYSEGNSFRYECMREYLDFYGDKCQGLVGDIIDDCISRKIIEVLSPSSLEICLEAYEKMKKNSDEIDMHWKKKIERLKYLEERAKRQYLLVEPEHRLVSRELEKNWEEAIEEYDNATYEYGQFQKKHKSSITKLVRDQILDLSISIPKMWDSSSTTLKDKKKIIRILIESVVVNVQGTTERVFVQMNWSGGSTTSVIAQRSVGRYEQLSYYPDLLKHIKNLNAKGYTPFQIRDELNSTTWKPPKRRDNFSVDQVRVLITKAVGKNCRTRKYKVEKLLLKNEWLLKNFCIVTEIPKSTLIHWMQRGWIKYRQLDFSMKYLIIWADKKEIKRLKDLHKKLRRQFSFSHK